MKSIFGFFAGAVIGAGGLFGLRKVLKMLDLDSTEAAPVGSKEPVSPSLYVSPSRAEETPDTATTTASKSEVAADLEKAQEAFSELEGLISMVGEPAARHQEPIAAVESAPEAVTPRSETAEEAVPDKVEVKPASTSPTESKNTAKAAYSGSNGAKKPARASRPPRTDDFTLILDIGPIFNQKLHDAGITSFKALVRLTPAQIEEKTGIPAERIQRGQWIEQVQKILASEAKE